MRMFGGVIALTQNLQNRAATREQGVYRILCLGESTTFAGSVQHSYPAVLEQVLNERRSDMRFSVVNAGVMGTTSELILDGLEENLDKYHPDMVITMIGINDDRHDVYNPARESESAWPMRLIGRLKVVQLIRHIGRHGSEKLSDDTDDTSGYDFWNYEVSNVEPDRLIEMAHRQMDAMNFTAAGNLLNQARTAQPDHPEIYEMLGSIAAYYARHEESVELFNKAIALDPSIEEPYTKLIERYYYVRDYPMAEQTIQALKANVPQSEQAYELLAQLYFQQQKYAKLKDILAEAEERLPNNYLLAKLRASFALVQGDHQASQRLFELAERLGRNYQMNDTAENYRAISRQILRRGIKHVAVQYPMRRLKPLKDMLGADARVTFVDNERSFKQAVQNGSYGQYFVDTFAGDFGHLTPAGNRQLAENIADKVLDSLY